MTATEEETNVYMILVKASNLDDTPNDLVKLTTEIKNLQTEVKNLQIAIHLNSMVIREANPEIFFKNRSDEE